MTIRNRFSTQVDADVDRRLRATVLGLRRQGMPVTLAEATTSALRAWCDQMVDGHNAGQEFDVPAERIRLPVGRPLEDTTRSDLS